MACNHFLDAGNSTTFWDEDKTSRLSELSVKWKMAVSLVSSISFSNKGNVFTLLAIYQDLVADHSRRGQPCVSLFLVSFSEPGAKVGKSRSKFLQLSSLVELD